MWERHRFIKSNNIKLIFSKSRKLDLIVELYKKLQIEMSLVEERVSLNDDNCKKMSRECIKCYNYLYSLARARNLLHPRK